jgi:hypothetical protein
MAEHPEQPAQPHSTAWVAHLREEVARSESGQTIVVPTFAQKTWAVDELSQLNKTGVVVEVKRKKRVQVGSGKDKGAAQDLFDQITQAAKPDPEVNDKE